MGKWISIIMQLYLWQKSLSKSNEIIDFAQRSLDHAKGYALAGIGLFASAFFLVAGLVTAIVQIGLQLERDGHLSFGGLMISSAIFFAISLFFALVSFIPLLMAKKTTTTPKTEPQAFQLESLYPLVEEFLKQLIHNLSQPAKEKKKKQKKNEESEAS